MTNYIAEHNLQYPPFWGMRKHMTVVSEVNKEKLQEIVDECSSINEVLGFFGLRVAGSNSSTLKKIMEFHNIDRSKLEENRKKAILLKNELIKINRSSATSYDEIKKKTFSIIRKYILKNKLLEYKCQVQECGNIGWHCGKPLTLELDHIDGDRSNNELSNLRFMCPSCHSQTETFSGKNKKTPKSIKFCKCGSKLSRSNISGICKSCTLREVEKSKKFEVTKEELESLVAEHSLLKIGVMFGVSDNAIRKRCKKLGIDVKSLSRFSHQRIVHTQKDLQSQVNMIAASV